jgi:hypothetical protein
LDGIQSGGSQILSYQIDYDHNTQESEWRELKGFSSNDHSLETIKDGLTISLEYRVRYRAKNIFGWSEYSDVTSIYTIMVPDVASTPVETTLIGTNVVFNWIEPSARGTAITYYNL